MYSEGYTGEWIPQASVLFSDIKGYSTLSQHQLERLFNKVYRDLGRLISDQNPFARNTWGDGLMAAFRFPANAAECALKLRDFFSDYNWDERGVELPELKIRTSLHSGPVYVGANPITDRQDIVGTHVNLGARVEPVTPPNQVFGTNDFINQLDTHEHGTIEWDYLGEHPLAKAWGRKDLYRIRRKRDSKEFAYHSHLQETQTLGADKTPFEEVTNVLKNSYVKVPSKVVSQDDYNLAHGQQSVLCLFLHFKESFVSGLSSENTKGNFLNSFLLRRVAPILKLYGLTEQRIGSDGQRFEVTGDGMAFLRNTLAKGM